MNIEDIRTYCLSFEEVEEGFPFGDDTLVFKTKGKIFLPPAFGNGRITLQCKM